jgi:hypothetical protein
MTQRQTKSTSIVLDDLTPGTDYTVTVQALFRGGGKSPAAKVQGSTKHGEDPYPPKADSGGKFPEMPVAFVHDWDADTYDPGTQINGPAGIYVQWTSGARDTDHFQIWRDDTNGKTGWEKAGEVGTDVRWWLEPKGHELIGHLLRYRVHAVNNKGGDNVSNTISGQITGTQRQQQQPPVEQHDDDVYDDQPHQEPEQEGPADGPGVPSTPTNLRAIEWTSGHIVLTWDAVTEGGRLELDRKVADNDWVQVMDRADNSRRYTDNDPLDPDAAVAYRLRHVAAEDDLLFAETDPLEGRVTDGE